MKSEWYVSTQVINGEKHYIAERLLDKQKIKHSGNVEHKGSYTTNMAAVAALVIGLNESETNLSPGE